MRKVMNVLGWMPFLGGVFALGWALRTMRDARTILREAIARQRAAIAQRNEATVLFTEANNILARARSVYQEAGYGGD